MVTFRQWRIFNSFLQDSTFTMLTDALVLSIWKVAIMKPDDFMYFDSFFLAGVSYSMILRLSVA